ncbi:hypothetical protein N7471_010656 [Penicillium samsonianum]|uniref:uncharacterized protein n=1 Tax=Penicillium samsonianum TaxID=1882272 RepID=UPI002548886F|nr:uncharacterized protein N7471_010656 [Penicillium samsonianum]KAJ6126163.1 hypothetical protein N7471_010656 [Penicillium samsonianum]
MSQFSDAGPSSRYESDADNLSFPRSDDAYLFTPESPSSQQTTVSVQDSSFLRPPPPPSIPQSLGRVGPNRTKNFILYSVMNKADFMDWCFRQWRQLRETRHQKAILDASLSGMEPESIRQAGKIWTRWHILTLVTLEKVSQLSLGKRRRSTVSSASDSEEENMDAQGRISDGEDGDDNDFPLPPIAHGEGNTQRRTSGRMSKRSRRDEELFEYYDPR